MALTAWRATTVNSVRCCFACALRHVQPQRACKQIAQVPPATLVKGKDKKNLPLNGSVDHMAKRLWLRAAATAPADINWYFIYDDE